MSCFAWLCCFVKDLYSYRYQGCFVYSLCETGFVFCMICLKEEKVLPVNKHRNLITFVHNLKIPSITMQFPPSFAQDNGCWNFHIVLPTPLLSGQLRPSPFFSPKKKQAPSEATERAGFRCDKFPCFYSAVDAPLYFRPDFRSYCSHFQMNSGHAPGLAQILRIEISNLLVERWLVVQPTAWLRLSGLLKFW